MKKKYHKYHIENFFFNLKQVKSLKNTQQSHQHLCRPLAGSLRDQHLRRDGLHLSAPLPGGRGQAPRLRLWHWRDHPGHGTGQTNPSLEQCNEAIIE